MRKRLIKCLLWILNSRWLNHSPCSYEFVGNIDAFSRAHIESELRQAPALTLRQFLKEMAKLYFRDGENTAGTTLHKVAIGIRTALAGTDTDVAKGSENAD